MISIWPAVGLGIASLVAIILAVLSLEAAPARLVRPNHGGVPVPAVLGLALVGGALLGALAASSLGDDGSALRASELVALAAVVIVGAAGLADDLWGGGPRGFRGHLGSALRLRPTTGILKLLVGVAAGVVVAVLLGGGPTRVVGTAVVLAVSTNVWNALDVVPGRALKWAAVVLVVAFPSSWVSGQGQVSGAALGAAAALLPFDLQERGMLGDAGANPLGFLVGLSVVLVLPTAGILAAAAVLLALQIAAETVTIGRLLLAVPFLRWFDDLGRVS